MKNERSHFNMVPTHEYKQHQIKQRHQEHAMHRVVEAIAQRRQYINGADIFTCNPDNISGHNDLPRPVSLTSTIQLSQEELQLYKVKYCRLRLIAHSVCTNYLNCTHSVSTRELLNDPQPVRHNCTRRISTTNESLVFNFI